MKVHSRFRLFACLIGSILIFSACSSKENPSTAQSSIPVAPTITQSNGPFVLEKAKTLCLAVTGIHTESTYAVAQTLLESMGFSVSPAGGSCEALVNVTMDGEAVSDIYNVNNTAQTKTCFTGASFRGNIQITTGDKIQQEAPILTKEIPPDLIVDQCPTADQAPFEMVGAKAIRSGFESIFGDRVLAAAVRVESLRADTSWIREGPYSDELINGLTVLLNDPDAWTRWYAASTLSYLRPVPVAAVDKAIETLKVESTRDPDVTSLVWGIIINAGPNAKGQISAICDYLVNSPDPIVRQDAARALANIGESTPEVVKALLVGMKNEDAWTRMMSARALGELKAPAVDTVQPLIDLLADADANVRQAAGQSLGEITGQNFGEIQSDWQTWWDGQ